MGSVTVPTTRIAGKEWLLLKNLGDVWELRGFKMDRNPRQVTEPSGHRSFEIKAKGGVKGRSTIWNAGNPLE